jgi:hypothetical protein
LIRSFKIEAKPAKDPVDYAVNNSNNIEILPVAKAEVIMKCFKIEGGVSINPEESNVRKYKFSWLL